MTFPRDFRLYIHMEKVCEKCSGKFTITEKDTQFYKKLSVPSPRLCLDCRQKRRFAYRNEWGLHKRKCDKCGVEMIAMFPEGDRTVYCDKCWWSDEFDPRAYGMDFDFNKPFFKQIDELMKKVPLPRLVIGDGENSEYTNYAWKLKNCYLVSASDYSEDCLYSTYLFRSKDCTDCLFVNDSELLYQGIDCKKCYSSAYLQNCQDLTDCYFCFDCRSCQDCLGCVGLRKKRYHIFNKEYSQEEYKKKKTEFLEKNKNLNELRTKFQEFKLKFPHKYAEIESCENCNGDHLNSCKNCENSFDLVECEDCNNCALGLKAKDCMDCTGVPTSELCYESVAIPENYSLKFCAVIWPKSSYLEYCVFSRSSKNCFGCISLLRNEYCILNKQYTKEEYEKLVPKIIEHMKKTGEYGEFFPMEISPFDYIETLAQDYYPLKQDENAETQSDKQFRIIETEKAFYKKMNLPLPDKSPLQRHRERMSLRTPRKIWARKCEKCGTGILTAYKEGSKEKLYCEKCYLQAVY